MINAKQVLSSITTHVGADALIRPAERSSAASLFHPAHNLFHDRIRIAFTFHHLACISRKRSLSYLPVCLFQKRVAQHFEKSLLPVFIFTLVKKIVLLQLP